MNEDQMHRILMIAAMVLTAISGLSCVGLLIVCAIQFSAAAFWASILLGVATIGFGYATTYFGQKVTAGSSGVFTNEAEREVLSHRQRTDLKRARGEVVMQRALDEIEKERQNIEHRAIEASHDPTRPPHKTRWTSEDNDGRQLR